MYEWEERKLV